MQGSFYGVMGPKKREMDIVFGYGFIMLKMIFLVVF